MTAPPRQGKNRPMYVVAFNGSPRSGGNTAVLLERALAGAASRGAEAELVHLGKGAVFGLGEVKVTTAAPE